MNIPMTNATPLRAIALFCSLGVTASYAVTLPYSNDFSSDPIEPTGDFSAATGYVYDAGLYGEVYHYERGSGATGLSLVDFPELGAAPTDFSVSTDFTPLLVGSGRSFGFAILSNTDSSRYLLVDWSTSQSLRLHEIGGAGLLNSESGSIVMTQDSNYTLTFTGQYTDTVNEIMDLTFTVSDGITSDSVTFSGFDASGLSGNSLVGYRSYGIYANSVNYDNFGITAIPEPSSWAMMLGVAMGALVIARRKKNRA